jgi:hypothetical protein
LESAQFKSIAEALSAPGQDNQIIAALDAQAQDVSGLAQDL